MFDWFIINPMTTALLVLYHLLGSNVFLTIVVFTVIIRLSVLPFTLYQQRSMKALQEVQPKIKELQEKYKDDREKLAQEQMALYKEEGVNPMASCLPIFIQMPILFGVWRAIIAALALSPKDLLGLEHRILFSGFWETVFSLNLDTVVPMNNRWLWLNLALPDPYYILPLLVLVSSLIQQRLFMSSMNTPTSTDPDDPSAQAAQMSQQMMRFMPFFFAFLALNYSSGLSIYFIVANIFSTVQYAAMGKANWRKFFNLADPEEANRPVDELPDTAVAVDSMGNTHRLKSGITDVKLSAKPKSSGRNKRTPSSSQSSRARRSSNRRKSK